VHIRKVRVIFDAWVEVNRLENVGDAMRDRVLAETLMTVKNPIVVIK
jgi:hypothetical protein